jgi:galactokinase
LYHPSNLINHQNSKATTTMTTEVLPLEKVPLSPSLKKLVDTSRKLYQDHLATPLHQKAWVTTAPGRVNLIGEHTDYTQGFVFPLAIEFSTVVYGTGSLTVVPETNDAPVTQASLKFVSSNHRDTVEQVQIDVHTPPPESAGSWTWYVAGTVAEYLKDLPPKGASLELSFAIAGDVPLGSGLSSSASLEVAVATFLECVLGDYAFRSETDKTASPAKIRAIRCQKAENIWCHSPCGIMVSYVVLRRTIVYDWL